MYELNKKYDELRLKYPDRDPNFFLPMLVSANRLNEPSSSSKPAFLFPRHNSERVAFEYRQRLNACKNAFTSLVDKDDSGFYAYKDSNGIYFFLMFILTLEVFKDTLY